MDNILNHPLGIYILIFLPIIYYIIRDIVGYFRNKKDMKKQEERIIAAQQELQTMIRHTEKSQQDLLQDLHRLKAGLARSADDILAKTERPTDTPDAV